MEQETMNEVDMLKLEISRLQIALDVSRASNVRMDELIKSKRLVEAPTPMQENENILLRKERTTLMNHIAELEKQRVCECGRIHTHQRVIRRIEPKMAKSGNSHSPEEIIFTGVKDGMPVYRFRCDVWKTLDNKREWLGKPWNLTITDMVLFMHAIRNAYTPEKKGV